MQFPKFFRRNHYISFLNAFNGVLHATKTQPNFVIHLIFLNVVIVASIVLKISKFEFLAILLISGFILTVEMINTALEALSDQVAKGEQLELIRIAKDVSAGAVLILAIVAIIMGSIIFVPRISALLQ